MVDKSVYKDQKGIWKGKINKKNGKKSIKVIRNAKTKIWKTLFNIETTRHARGQQNIARCDIRQSLRGYNEKTITA